MRMSYVVEWRNTQFTFQFFFFKKGFEMQYVLQFWKWTASIQLSTCEMWEHTILSFMFIWPKIPENKNQSPHSMSTDENSNYSVKIGIESTVWRNKQRKDEKERKTKMQKAKNGWSPFLDVIGLRSTMPNDLSHVLFNSCSYSWTSGISTKQLILEWHEKVIQFGLDSMIRSIPDWSSLILFFLHGSIVRIQSREQCKQISTINIFANISFRQQFLKHFTPIRIPIRRVPTVIGMKEKESKK